MQHPVIHWLNDDILLNIFNCYRLDDEFRWNHRFLWFKLSRVCQRWRHLIHESAFHLGMEIKCTNGTRIVDTLDHLPPLPLFVDYTLTIPTKQDELGIYHALRLHDRVRHIGLVLLPSILQKFITLMNEHFPTLEHLSLTFSQSESATSTNNLPLTFPKAFLAPKLRHLALPNISPPRRLQLLTATASLIILQFNEIQKSSYFRPRLLVARLSSLPQLEKLSISFSVPIPRPSSERELLGEKGALVTLPSLKNLEFTGAGAYLESLVAQIRAPLLEKLRIKLFNQIAFVQPHLSYLINITEAFKLPSAVVGFDPDEVYVIMGRRPGWGPFKFHVKCNQLDWQIDCAAQICSTLIPALSCVELIRLACFHKKIPVEWQNSAVDGSTWHELLRSFMGVKELHIEKLLLEELSCALQADVVGSDPGFLPNLQSIGGGSNLFTSFIDTRQVVGRPVQFLQTAF